DIIDRLKRVGAYDVLASNGLLAQLVYMAEWREPGRGSIVGGTLSSLAERFGYSYWRLSRLFEPLEAPDPVPPGLQRGHVGEIVGLVYDELVRSATAPTAKRPGDSRPSEVITAPTAKRPGETRGPDDPDPQLRPPRSDEVITAPTAMVTAPTAKVTA